MLIDDQSDIIDVLKQSKTYGLKNEKVDIVETNISLVFLVGDKAYKLKKGVKFPYADFSTPEKRLLSCRQELMTCERFASGICLGIETVVRNAKGRLFLREFCRDTDAQIVDYLLVMHRFPEEDFYLNKIRDGSVDRFEMMDLAERIWELHADAPVFKMRGGAEVIRRRIIENNTLSKCFSPEVFDLKDVERLDKAQLAELDKHAALLDKRRDEGKIRWCHGDLRLTNVVMFQNRVTLFNPIDFYEDLSQIDTLYDVAFLLMDMASLGLNRLASILFNHYMACSADWEGIPVLPLFMSCRAGVQAYVFAQRAVDAADSAQKEKFAAQARSYLDWAYKFLNPAPPVVVACGGLSGSGKSRMAREMAPVVALPPGAIVLRDDVLRKNMENVAQTADLGEDSYLGAGEQAVYDRLCKEAENVIRNGHSVVLDALFFKPEFRDQAEALAKKTGVAFCGFWVDAPLDVRAGRVAKRKRNPSDMKSLDALKKQLDIDVGEVRWHKIDSSRDRNETLQNVFDILKKNGIGIQ